MTVVDTNNEIEQFRSELTAYCYRMMGSIFEAEDAVQETMIRAWRNLDKFEGRSSLRSWLYRIATNVCLSALDTSERKRVRPVDFGGPSQANMPTVPPKREEIPWLEPAPDSRLFGPDQDPAEVAEIRDSVRLAFVAALQHLPAKQRAALILCDVLKWKSDEAAALLETSTAAINSALQRARSTLETQDIDKPAQMPNDVQSLAQQYAKSFEAYDMDSLVAMLHEDVIMSMPPFDMWFQGPSEVSAWMTGHGHGCEGSVLKATTANGSAAFGQYRKNPDGGYFPWALQVIEFDGERISTITAFLDTPSLFPLFGLPMEISA